MLPSSQYTLTSVGISPSMGVSMPIEVAGSRYGATLAARRRRGPVGGAESARGRRSPSAEATRPTAPAQPRRRRAGGRRRLVVSMDVVSLCGLWCDGWVGGGWVTPAAGGGGSTRQRAASRPPCRRPPAITSSSVRRRRSAATLRLARATASTRATPLNSGVIQYTPLGEGELQALDAERQGVDGEDRPPHVGPRAELRRAEEHGGERREQQRRAERVGERADLGAVDDPGDGRRRRPRPRASPTPGGRCARPTAGPTRGWRRWRTGGGRAGCTRARTTPRGRWRRGSRRRSGCRARPGGRSRGTSRRTRR